MTVHSFKYGFDLFAGGTKPTAGSTGLVQKDEYHRRQSVDGSGPTYKGATLIDAAREARRRERLPKSVFGRFSTAIWFFPPARFAQHSIGVCFL
jgi:hypothetical protein